MSLWIPVAASLRAEYFRPVDYGTASPGTVIAHSAIIAADLRLHHVKVKARCWANEWMALRALAAAENEPNKPPLAVPQTVTRDMNDNRIAFASFMVGGKFCALRREDFAHITGPAFVQDQVRFVIPGSVARDASGILAPGILPFASWPGCEKSVRRSVSTTAACAKGHGDAAVVARIPAGDANRSTGCEDAAGIPRAASTASADKNLEGEKAGSGDADAAGMGSEAEIIAEIPTFGVGDGVLSRQKWPADELSLADIIMTAEDFPWDVCFAQWKRANNGDDGYVEFVFPVVAIGGTYDLTRVGRKVAGHVGGVY